MSTKQTLLGPFVQASTPKRPPHMIENQGGVPLLSEVFCPFFGKILVQTALFIGARESNFMRKNCKIKGIYRKWGGKVPSALVEMPPKRIQNGLFPLGDTPFLEN
jgi:hypothetical protein